MENTTLQGVEIFIRDLRLKATHGADESFNMKSEGKYLCVRK